MLLSENFAEFSLLLQDFFGQISESINSPKQLAELMARKARLLALKIEKALNFDYELGIKSEIAAEFTSFRQVLIADLQAKNFADVYA